MEHPMKIPDHVLLKDALKTIREKNVTIGMNESYIQELENTIKELIKATPEEKMEIKKDSRIQELRYQIHQLEKKNKSLEKMNSILISKTMNNDKGICRKDNS